MNRVGLILVIILGLLTVFQNCADPLDLASQDSLSFNDELPFAYDTKVDTIAYMSCSNMTSDFHPRAYFTFKAGAFGSGSGIGLTDDFRSAVKNFTAGQISNALAESKTNVGATIQLSIRQINDFNSMLTGSGGVSVSEGKDFDNIVAPLDSTLIRERISGLDNGERINYFTGIQGLTGRTVEGAIRFLDSETTAVSVRDHLRDAGLLTLTYADADDSASIVARGPEGSNRVFGTGFQINQFRMGRGVSNTNPDARPLFTLGTRRVIDSVTEVDLLNRPASVSGVRPWECPDDFVFLVARPQDVADGTINCQALTDPIQPADAIEEAKLKAIRRVLAVEDWFVDLARNCIIPKSASTSTCYGTDPNPIVYSGGDCSADDVECPHYVSVCIRN